MILTTEVNGCFLYLLPRKRSEAKLGVKWQIRIGDFDHQSNLDDADVLILDIIDTDIHPDYNDDTAYFDVGILKTQPGAKIYIVGYVSTLDWQSGKVSLVSLVWRLTGVLTDTSMFPIFFTKLVLDSFLYNNFPKVTTELK